MNKDKFTESKSLVHKAFVAFKASPPDLREIGDQNGEISYVYNALPRYEKTVSDILKLFPERSSLQGLNFVELGAFLGIVSKALSLASATIIACDIPEFFARENVRTYYRSMGIEIQAFNLRNYFFPFSSFSQDCVIASEVFEHLNFNPLPVFAEINRVLKAGGFFYLTMPNGSCLLNRIKFLLSGDMPGFSVDELFAQLDPNDNMVVGLHWKEYSLSQTISMVSPIGFEIVSANTFDSSSKKSFFFKSLLKWLVPSGYGDMQVVIFKKIAEFENIFSICTDS